MLLSWLLMRELQVRVAHGALSVSFGPFRTSVPLERIESVRLVTYDWKLSTIDIRESASLAEPWSRRIKRSLRHSE